MINDKPGFPLINQHIAEKLYEANLEIQEKTYLPGQLILKKGEISEHLHIIVSGQVSVYIEQERKVQLAVLEREQFFGEMSCLTGDPISANVEAIYEVQTIIVCRTGMMLLMDENADFRMQIIEAMVKRIQSSNDRVLEEHAKSLLIMKHHETEGQERYGELVGESEAIQKLRKLIERHASKQQHLIILGEPGTEKMAVARILHDLSTNGHYPFLIINSKEFDLLTWHTKKQAAKEGTVVVEDAELLPLEILNQLTKTNVQTRVLLTTSKPLNLNSLVTLSIPPLRERVEDIPLLVQHFVMKGGADDVETAISEDALRLLSLFPFLKNNVEELHNVIKDAYVLSEGRKIYSNHLRFGNSRQPGERPKIGLALGSGSTRGMAHLGVWKVMEEEGIPIDMIAGTSAGSMVGGAYAAGMQLKDIIKIMSSIRWGQIVRPTIPIRSFVQNSPMIKFLEQHMGKHLIEELPIPFAIVASEVATGDAHIMRTGSLAHAITASTAIPSIMRPVKFQDKILVDGAVVHPVPAALVKSMGADIVIAVNVCAESFAKGTVRHFIDSLLNTIDMMSAKMVKEELQLADVVLRPDLGYNQIGFKDLQFCLDAGEVVTRDAISQIQKKITSF